MPTGNPPLLIGLSGCHGTGKTSVANALRDRGYWVTQGSLSRAAQEKLGVQVSDVLDLNTSLQLQLAITESLIERDKKEFMRAWEKGAPAVFVDRSPVDVIGYNQMWMHENADKLNALSIEEAQAFNEKMLNLIFTLEHHARNWYNYLVLFPRMGHIAFVPEATRANSESQAFTEFQMRYAAELIECNRNSKANLYIIGGETVEDRVQEILREARLTNEFSKTQARQV